MATGGCKKQKKMKQKDYLTLISSPNNVEKWLANTSISDKSNSPEEPKQFKVKQKEYTEFLSQPKFDGTSDEEKSDSKSLRAIKSPKYGAKKDRLKVKQKDLLEVINVSNLSDKRSTDKSFNEKASVQKRYVFTNGFETTNKPEPTRRIVFQPKTKYEISGKPCPEMVKRYHSPNEISQVLEKCSSPVRARRKHERTRLKEENPVDFGSMIMDRFSSVKNKKSNKDTTSIKRNKMPIFNGNSKQYDLVKEQKIFNEKELSFSGGTHSQSEEEIFISLDKKSPREKDDMINENMPEILSPSVENDSLSERRFSIDGTRVSRSEKNNSKDFSELNKKDEMLF